MTLTLGEDGPIFARMKWTRPLPILANAIHLDPNSQSAYYNRALILLQRGEFNQALADLNEAVRCDPKSVDALIVRGLCRVAMNDLDRALASFDGAIVTAPFNAMAYIQRSKLYSRKGERDKQERDYQQALRLDSNIERASNESSAMVWREAVGALGW